ncbi:BTAD domain-containing putative transcriptional regulator [Parafrankia sp. BMG5.11]|uniref:BTAD domain-containing putative transcriptional regulator n=1 Tax=Parafrankia sp. BMG5.11 TaxID=222540 RepID=UPI0010406C98|nr:BTAD domain-containing putative transcriptional regulator [Parafrankia sp. BMG5.11]TCJ36566.1 LysM peptidoglycan-binding domain-containing protein [Parafrankia sp. BMG5.11]
MSRRARPRRVRPLHRLGGLLRALAGLTATSAVLIAAPAAMWQLIGWPLPDHVPRWTEIVDTASSPLTQDLILGLIGALFWYTYALIAVSIAVEVVATIGGWHRPRLPTGGPAQALAAVLVGTILAGLLTATTRTSTGPPTSAVLAAYQRPAPVTAPADPTAPAGPSCTVAPYDTLWSLAETWLRDGLRWHDIWALNHGRIQPDGTQLTTPDLLRPGWILHLPPDAQPPAGHTPPAPAAPSTAIPLPPTGPSGPQADIPAAAPSPTAPTPRSPSTPQRSNPTPAWTPTLPPAPVAPGPSATPPPHTPPPTSTPPPPHTAPGQDHPIRLPSGAVLPLGLITALAAAVTIARLLRTRRRPVPTPPGQPISTDPPLPLVIREILRASRPPTTDDDDPEPVSDPSAAPPPATGLSTAVLHASAPDSQAPPSPTTTPSTSTTTPGRIDPEEPAEGLPTELLRTGRLDLHGPSAPAAARAVVLGVLADHHRDRTTWPARLIIPDDAVSLLDLPRPLLDALPQVTVTASTDAALDLADREALRRARLTDGTTTTSLDELRAALPDEMIPTVLLLASAPNPHDGRLTALTHSGARLGIYTITVEPTTDPAGDDQPPLPWQLTPAQASDLLHVLTQATDQPTPPGVETPASIPPHTPVAGARPATPTVAPPPPKPAPSPATTTPPPCEPAPTSTPAQPAEQTNHPDQPGRRVRLVLFGRPAVHLDRTPLAGGLRTLSLEIAAYLAVHPGGITGDRLAGELLPDQDPTRARNQIYRAVAALRDTLRTATGDPTLTPILSGKAGYRLDPTLITVDLWEFDTALTAAGHANDDPARITALTRAADLATATPFGDTAYDWSAPTVTDLEHRAVDALADLADLHADDHPEQALAYLEHALALTPTVEDLYRHVMRIHAARRRPDAVRRTYQRLRDALDTHGLDVDPTPETQALLAHLTRTPPKPAPTQTGPRRIIRPATTLRPERPSS